MRLVWAETAKAASMEVKTKARSICAIIIFTFRAGFRLAPARVVLLVKGLVQHRYSVEPVRTAKVVFDIECEPSGSARATEVQPCRILEVVLVFYLVILTR